MGMNLNNFIGGDFLSKEDLLTSNKWIIKDILESKIDEKVNPQLLLEIDGMTREFTLNLINTKRLIELFGSDSDKSIGKVVFFKLVDTEFKGKPTKGIRIDSEMTKQFNSIDSKVTEEVVQ